MHANPILECFQANHGGLKQKSDIEHYRNKLRQKARRKGYGEFSLSETGSHGYSHRDARHGRHDNGLKEPMTAEEKRASFAGCHKRYKVQETPKIYHVFECNGLKSTVASPTEL